MKILIMGEGPTDVGYIDNQTGFVEGPVCVLLRHSQRSLRTLHGQGKYAWWEKEKAIEEGADVALFYCDADREGGEDSRDRKNCKKRFDEVKKGIEDGFAAYEGENQVRTMAVVAVKMIESWLMADPESFNKAFGKPKNSKSNRNMFPKNPELEWGAKNQPQSNYPKNQIKRILDQYQQEPNRDTFRKLAEEANIDVLKEKCPISFSDFYNQVQKLKEEGMPN